MNIEIEKFIIDSKNELLEILKKSNCETLLLGNDCESAYKYYLLNIKIENGKEYAIGLILDSYCLEPCFICKTNSLYVGLNSDVYIFSFQEDINNKRISLDSPFNSFVLYDDIIIFCELNVMCITVDGDLVWTFMSRFNEDYKIIGDKLVIKSDDEKTVTLSIANGFIN